LAAEIHSRHLISPNLHVILVHFPLGIFVFGLFLEVCSFAWRRSTVRVAAHWMVLFGGLLAVPAALSGIDALRDVVKNSRPYLNDDQWAVLRQHVLITSIGAGLAALTVTAALGLTDIWRRNRLVYFVLWLLLVVAAGLLTFGSHFGGEGIYLEGIAVGLKRGAAKGFEYWAPAQSMHLLMAGLGAAVTLGALGMSIRVMLGIRVAEDEAVTEKELELLHEEAGAVPPGSVPTAVSVPAGANDLTMARTLNADTQIPMPRLPAARFWLLATLLFVVTFGFGVWFLISQQLEGWLDTNKPTPAALWQVTYETARNTPKLSENRRGAHILIGIALVVLPLILALGVRFGPRRRVIVGLLCGVILALLASEIWLGVLLLHDSASGPLYRFAPPDQSSTLPVQGRGTLAGLCVGID
jgi:uncharacterized membrane protein